ncbi:MAG TPA: helix-turn-helix transcriptional regulator [Candidatus Limnocylindrales bacterium]
MEAHRPQDLGDLDPAAIVGRARAAYDEGHLAAAADLALLASDAGVARGDRSAVLAAALAWTGVPDPRMATATEHLCRQALRMQDPADVALAARLHGQRSVALHLLERFDEARAEAQAAGSLADSTQDPMAGIAARHARQLDIAGVGSGLALADLGEQMLADAGRTPDPDAGLLARSCRLEGRLRVGDTAGARHDIAALEVHATRTGRPLDRWNALLARAGLEQALGGFADAEVHAREARAALPPDQRPHTEPLFAAQLLLISTDTAHEPEEAVDARGFIVGGPLIAIAMTGRFDLELGNRARARLALEAVRYRLDDIALDRRGLPTLTAAVELAAAFSDVELATAIGERLAPFDGAMIVSALGAVGPVAHFLGIVDRLRGEAAAAVAHATSATTLATKGGFGPWAARSRLALAEALALDGSAGMRRAPREATLALEAATQLGMRGLVARASGLADRLNSSRRLSSREAEIAGLIASGASNRQIADRLVLSERTVETHVQHVLEKLDFQSRTQVAAWAVEVDLPRPPGPLP